MTIAGSPAKSHERISVRAPTMDDPWMWLQAGWRDLLRTPGYSLGYGLAFVLVGLAITAGLWSIGLESLVPAVSLGFALLGPLLAVGLYEISRRLEAGEPLEPAAILRPTVAAPVQMGLLAFFLMFIFFCWLRIATLLYALFIANDYRPFGEFVAFVLTSAPGLTMLVVGSAVGLALLLVAFAATALSVPILMRHDVDAATAMWLSISTVIKHPGPMLLWGWLVAIIVGFGFATLFVGLIFAFPLLGHATWHAYRSLVQPA